MHLQIAPHCIQFLNGMPNIHAGNTPQLRTPELQVFQHDPCCHSEALLHKNEQATGTAGPANNVKVAGQRRANRILFVAPPKKDTMRGDKVAGLPELDRIMYAGCAIGMIE